MLKIGKLPIIENFDEAQKSTASSNLTTKIIRAVASEDITARVSPKMLWII
jgi:hypothetical protein